ncbi:MAG TPA: helix-turn-helix domain-containing protein [Candidatus Bathyarchaeia archaeon]|nr:helix-turn-helix domain-containing protein [Candidatus Bathyarchaeia archaeon]
MRSGIPNYEAGDREGAADIAGVKLLSDFGLGEKEAQLYVHLLKYGPKRASDLARSLKTYRLNVYRKLAALVDKNLVSARRESPCVYTAASLDDALNTMLLPRQRELARMEEIKKELIVRAKGAPLLASDETSVSKILTIDNEQALTKLLSDFGLGEKEAQLYVHLLKYGPKRATDLARSLKTYREDAYRRCAKLIDIGMITKSKADSSRYVPISLNEALDAALLAHHKKLDPLRETKQEVIEPAQNSLEAAASQMFKMLTTVGEVVSAISHLINTAEASIAFVAHPHFKLMSMGGFVNHYRSAVQRGVRVRGVLPCSANNVSAVRQYLNSGVELRLQDEYRGITTLVADEKRSVSVIHANLKAMLSLDEPVAALWSDSSEQAEFLMSAFDFAWKQAVPAEQRIDELLKEGLLNLDLCEVPLIGRAP